MNVGVRLQLSVKLCGGGVLVLYEQEATLAATVISDGQVIFGGSSSMTVNIYVQGVMFTLPASSVAVIVITLSPSGVNVIWLLLSEALQLSLALDGGGNKPLETTAPGRVQVGQYEQPELVTTVTLGGQSRMVGGSISLTVTLKLQMFVFPAASVAVAIPGFVPTGKFKLEGLKIILGLAVQLSIAIIKEELIVALHCPRSLTTTIEFGQVTKVGACISATVTITWHVEVAIQASVAVNVTMFGPNGKTPDELFVKMTGEHPSVTEIRVGCVNNPL
jgi:hypothetical protein